MAESPTFDGPRFLAEPEDPTKVRFIAEPEDLNSVCFVPVVDGHVNICDLSTETRPPPVHRHESAPQRVLIDRHRHQQIELNAACTLPAASIRHPTLRGDAMSGRASPLGAMGVMSRQLVSALLITFQRSSLEGSQRHALSQVDRVHLEFLAMSSDGYYTLGAFAVVCDSDDRVLMSHRRDLDLWNLPGGRVQVDELPDVAAVREVREEAGLDVEVVRLTGVYGRSDGGADMVFTFECRVVGGTLGPTEEADRHEWFDVDQLPINTSPKQVVRVRDALLRVPEPIFRTLTEPSGRRWLEILAERDRQQPA